MPHLSGKMYSLAAQQKRLISFEVILLPDGSIFVTDCSEKAKKGRDFLPSPIMFSLLYILMLFSQLLVGYDQEEEEAVDPVFQEEEEANDPVSQQDNSAESLDGYVSAP